MNHTCTFILFFLLLSANVCFAQNESKPITQNIRGIVTDEASSAPIPYATVYPADEPTKGTSTDSEGKFLLENVSLGRHTVEVRFIGYETVTLREILTTSAKEVYLEISMKEQVIAIDGIVVRPRVNKEEPLNSTATTGARMLSVEEASRYAGGMDDPARLVSSFAGVASDVSHNGISIHGNSPHLLQWRLEGVEIPNPNHYADISTLGGGILSSLSSHVLGNSDFFSGAFPAEYGNAVSGVFDIKMRNGNSYENENTFQIGVLGLDIASEGPFSKKSNASYLFNYRYSTLGLLEKIDPSMNLGGGFDYQDLNFKLNFPTAKAGTFTLWGTGLIDKYEDEFFANPDEWIHTGDNFTYDTKQYMGAAGLGHHYRFGTKGYLKTTLATTYSNLTGGQDSYNNDLTFSPYLDLSRRNTNIVLTSAYNHKFGAMHTNRTGFTYTRMIFDMNLGMAPLENRPLETISKGNGQADLINIYTNSTLNLTDRLTANIGINGQMLTLNDSWSLEPRAGMKFLAGKRTTLAFAYGLNSRMEMPDVYYVRSNGSDDRPVNKNLGFTKAHHLMFTYGYKLSENTVLRIEPYYQYLFDIPVEEGSSFAVINRTDYYVERALTNKGKGRNYGIDFTLEKYLTNGLYYMVTATVFDSKYRGGDGNWYDTRYNRKYIVNGLVGKEWMMGRNKRNTLNLNLKATYQGGERYSPVDEAATLAHPDKEVQYDETRAFTEQYPAMFIVNFSGGYRINRPKVSHEFGFVFMNLTRAPEYHGYHYNLKDNMIERNGSGAGITNISYRIHF